MQRILEEFVSLGYLYNFPKIHDRNSVTDVSYGAEVV